MEKDWTGSTILARLTSGQPVLRFEFVVSFNDQHFDCLPRPSLYFLPFLFVTSTPFIKSLKHIGHFEFERKPGSVLCRIVLWYCFGNGDRLFYCELVGTSSHTEFDNATPEQRSIHAETIVQTRAIMSLAQDNGVNEKRAPAITFWKAMPDIWTSLFLVCFRSGSVLFV